MRTIFRLLGFIVLLVLFLLLFRPDFITRAGNALVSAVGGSNASGAVQVIPSLQGNTGNLLVNLQNLSSHTPYVITLDQGQCGGPAIQTFANIKTDSNGNISGNFAFANLQALIQKGVWIDVHAGNSASGQTVACGQVQINQTLLSSTPTPTPTTTSSSSSSSSPTTIIVGLPASGNSTGTPGFPQTGVAPAQQNSYDNYKYPRKY